MRGKQALVRALGFVGLAFAVCIFAGGFASARLYIEAGGTPADVVALRYGISGLLFLPVVWMARARLRRPGGWARALALAAVGGAPFGVCIFIGVTGAPFTHGAGIVPAMALVVGSLLAWQFLGEPLGPQRIAGIVLAILGLIALLLPAAGDGEVHWWGELAYFGGGLLWAGWTVLLRGFGFNPLQGAAFAAVFSAPYLVLYAGWLEPRFLEVALEQTLIHGFYQGVMFNTVGIGIYAWSVSRLGAATAVAAMPLMPLYATFMEWGMFDWTPHAWVWTALLLMAVGIAMAAFAGPGKSGVRFESERSRPK